VSIKVSIRKRLSKNFCLETEFETSGSALGILGASGSGKSMTLKCIAGIETPDSGYIALNNRVLFDSKKKINIKPQARKAGYLFQNYALFPTMTVLENITVSLSLSKQKRYEKAYDWIERFELKGLEHRYPSELSGGQQQRTALARMLLMNPEIILLDEPFSALDAHLREQMQFLLLDLMETRDDVVLVSHSRDEVYKLCGELAVIDNGRILQKGHTKELFQNPITVQTARITGCKNISPIKRTGEKEIYALHWGLTLKVPVPVSSDITHIGIRAHDFTPVFDPEENLCNRIRVRSIRRLEEPFEETLVFTNADYDASEKLLWKYSAYMFQKIPEELFLPSKSLLLLR